MQLGITIPLQKHLKVKQPPYGEPIDLFFCWELHVIRFMGKRALAMVNANNRFFVTLAGMKAADWKVLPERAEEAIEAGLRSKGYKEEQINAYFNLAGALKITKTHGRKPVAGLNKAIERLYYTDEPWNLGEMYQEDICHWVNRDICSPAGFETYDHPCALLEEDMKRVGIVKRGKGQ
ncbi:DUF6933 domain-containing protein [Anaerostipes caccae]|uniref:DUF6933 domain-containing protein n=1 Tax=Anaerostipes caccae TaxID=105841 RepID=UPI0038D4424F